MKGRMLTALFASVFGATRAFEGKHRSARVQRFQSKHDKQHRAKRKRKRKQAKWSRVHT